MLETNSRENCAMASKKREKGEQTSHKVIEKRRRDRINNCLAELSQTVPAAFAKQSSGKLEKAEILEMTVEYLRAIQTTEIGVRFESGEWFSSDIWADFMQHYQAGYSECMREVLRYMTDVEGLNVNDNRCVRILSYLQTRFRPDSSVSGGTAHREKVYRQTSTRYTSVSHVYQHSPMRGTHRVAPYTMPVGASSVPLDTFNTDLINLKSGNHPLDNTPSMVNSMLPLHNGVSSQIKTQPPHTLLSSRISEGASNGLHVPRTFNGPNEMHFSAFTRHQCRGPPRNNTHNR